MPAYPMTKLDRAVDKAIAEANREYLETLEAAGPDACPNCLRTGRGWCWCCTDSLEEARDKDAYLFANRPRAEVERDLEDWHRWNGTA
jgi:hypothetical protein